ncbi:MAG: DNA mismatch endonuclease Vsr [Chitinivibrionales bacterium]|nr:DNA mismatch endonuclease Vsr [Chitinivibrionales bacterium]MBD3358197.1 DNA mismatch endonuclease Vsr [Chitinivibrionales bacterium]
MLDVFNKEKRSWIMARVKNKDTKPEVKVRSVVHRLGYRFRKNRTDLPGRPDIVLPRHRKVIFVHGCFWHGHPNCPRAARPSSNEAFWRKKLNANIVRDRKNIHLLREQGWRVMVLWECRMRDEKALLNRIKTFLKEQ